MMFLFNILYFYGHVSSRWVFLAYSVLPILMFFLNFYIFPTSSKSPTSPPGQELVEHTSENHQNIINEKESRYKEAIGSDPLLFDDSDEFDNISNSHSLDDEISSIISLIKIGPWLPEKSFCSILSSSLFWLSALWLAGILLPFPPPFYLFPLLLPPFSSPFPPITSPSSYLPFAPSSLSPFSPSPVLPSSLPPFPPPMFPLFIAPSLPPSPSSSALFSSFLSPYQKRKKR